MTERYSLAIVIVKIPGFKTSTLHKILAKSVMYFVELTSCLPYKRDPYY